MITKKSQYKDFTINIKILLSGLWVTVMFLYIYGDYFELYVPGKVNGLLNGQNLLNTPLRLFFAAFVLTLPALMIFLSLLMRPKWKRVLNISIGLFFTLFTLLVGISSFAEWRVFYVVLAFLESIITATIVWMAFRWPKS